MSDDIDMLIVPCCCQRWQVDGPVSEEAVMLLLLRQHKMGCHVAWLHNSGRAWSIRTSC